jgi:plastocyanin
MRTRVPGNGTRTAARAVRLGVAALLLLVMAACSHRPARHEVVIHAMAFDPPRLVVAAGDTVVWTNRDLVPHTATGAQGGWTSPMIAPGATWREAFQKRGVNPYFCQVHPNMKGAVDVR